MRPACLTIRMSDNVFTVCDEHIMFLSGFGPTFKKLHSHMEKITEVCACVNCVSLRHVLLLRVCVYVCMQHLL